MEDQSEIEFQVELDSLPLRLDVYLAGRLPDLSRSRIQKLVEEGQVLVDERRAKASLKLKGGERLRVVIKPSEPYFVSAQDIPLDVVYEDAYLVVVNKAAGLITHPGAGVKEGTLVNALLYHCRGQLSGISGCLRPGIVHRLDKDTTGLLVIAKEDRTHRGLSEQIRQKTARREYTALLEGALNEDSGVVDKPIGRHPRRRTEMSITKAGRQAVSRFTVLRRFCDYTLVEVSLETGRTHQIRVHMASLGFPIVGDIVYNRKRTGTLTARRRLGLKGQALHATRLSFAHPITGVLLQFEAPLPDDFNRLVNSLS